jgi:hypothetical protein
MKKGGGRENIFAVAIMRLVGLVCQDEEWVLRNLSNRNRLRRANGALGYGVHG